MRSIRFGLIAVALCGVVALAGGIAVAVAALHGASFASRPGLGGNPALAARFREIYVWAVVAVVIVDALVVAALASLGIAIRRMREQQRDEAHQAMHDPLTGLPNRRYLGEWLNIALAAARRGERQVALLYIDLDGFKSINDRFGHEVGDQVLQITATRLRGALRASDFFARLGGDEFVAMLAEAPDAPLPAIVGRLQTVIMKAPLAEVGDGEVRASVGAAWYPDDGDTIEMLLAAADRAMYVIKQDHHRATAAARPAATPSREIVTGDQRSAG